MNRRHRLLRWLKKPHGIALFLFYLFAVASIIGAIYMTTVESNVIAYTIAMVQMVYANKGFIHIGLTIYASAIHTFYKATMSVIHLVKAKKEQDYCIQSLRNIGFAEALVSLLALQTAMFASFSDGQMNTAIPNAITGGVVVLIILTLGIYMIIKGKQQLKKINEGVKEDE